MCSFEIPGMEFTECQDMNHAYVHNKNAYFVF
jgi:hypothetical protein